MSEAELAQQIGMSRAGIKKWQHGTSPGLDKVIAAASATKVSAGWLASGEADSEWLDRGYPLKSERYIKNPPAHLRRDSPSIHPVVDNLERISQLHTSGLLTDDEFAKLKTKLIDSI